MLPPARSGIVSERPSPRRSARMVDFDDPIASEGQAI